LYKPARIIHELLSRDHEDGRATWQPQGVGLEAHLNGTSQGELVLLRYAQDKFPRRRNTRGRQVGRPYPWSQQVIHELSGLEGLSNLEDRHKSLKQDFEVEAE
jgi:hypothetical protein